ncbi:MAG: hypothetical protein AAFY15_00055 [Cyanobacteria bacterium J06648_11]
MPREKERTIAYRLSRPYTDRLEARAAELGLSVGQYARLVLVMHFEETASHRVADELEKLRAEVTDLRIEQALTRKAA